MSALFILRVLQRHSFEILDSPGNNIHGLQPVGVSVPAQHEEQIARGRGEGAEDYEAFVAASSENENISSVYAVYTLKRKIGCHENIRLRAYLWISQPDIMPPTALPATAGNK